MSQRNQQFTKAIWVHRGGPWSHLPDIDDLQARSFSETSIGGGCSPHLPLPDPSTFSLQSYRPRAPFPSPGCATALYSSYFVALVHSSSWL